jgi:hypothetical protein
VRTGEFVSSRYGKFVIAREDLRMMAANFQPGATPIDYDHLSGSPKRPGDGIAAGWLKALELRDGGNTLWGLVDWTPTAAKHIKDGEYKFISPSFIKDYTDPVGRKVGTKLVAAALTNLPFLPSMAAVTLTSDAVFGSLALPTTDESAPKNHDNSQETAMPNTTTTEIQNNAAAFAERVKTLSKGRSLRDAITLATSQDAIGAEAYRLAGIGAEMDPAPEAAPVLSLSAEPGESFDAMCVRYANEYCVPLRDAIRAVGKARPDLAEAR